jgi:hypothetical protein
MQAIQYLLNVLARLGARSVIAALVVAFVVATVVFGLSVNEVSANPGWCPGCK